jgi:hypothetical protein
VLFHSLVFNLPLTERVEFKAVLQKGNRFQVPKIVRWRYKLECAQVLKVSIMPACLLSGWETFHGRMDRSGRVTVSRLVQTELLRKAPGQESLAGTVLNVRLEP